MASSSNDHTDHSILETLDSLANSLIASPAMLANDLPGSENIDLEDVFVVIDSLDLKNFVFDDHLSAFSVSATDKWCIQTLCHLV